jgi:hypothetical protein
MIVFVVVVVVVVVSFGSQKCTQLLFSFFILILISCTIKRIENNQPNTLNLMLLSIPYNGSYMFRQLYAIIRKHLSTF